jgi:hypothetical protein
MPRPRRPFGLRPVVESLGRRALPSSVAIPLPENPFADPVDITESAYVPDVGYPYPAPVRDGDDSSPDPDPPLSPDVSAGYEPGFDAGVSSVLSPEGSGSGLPTMVGD